MSSVRDFLPSEPLEEKLNSMVMNHSYVILERVIINYPLLFVYISGSKCDDESSLVMKEQFFSASIEVTVSSNSPLACFLVVTQWDFFFILHYLYIPSHHILSQFQKLLFFFLSILNLNSQTTPLVFYPISYYLHSKTKIKSKKWYPAQIISYGNASKTTIPS